MRVVYSYFVMDILHRGHLRMLEQGKAIAGREGKLIVGILTDGAVIERKPPPVLSFAHRMEIAKAICHIDAIVPQETYSPIPNVRAIRPNVLLESTSHTEADIAEARRNMHEIGGEVIVIPYLEGISSTLIKQKICGRDVGEL